MNNYRELGLKIINKGMPIKKRNGVRVSLFGETFRHNMSDGFPMVTSRYVPFKLIVSELVWFLKGRTDITFLHEYNNHVWDKNFEAYDVPGNSLGPIYGKQWRRATNDIDQLKNVLENIKENPYSTKHLVDSWSVSEVKYMALEPCHFAFQFHCIPPNLMSIQVYQRSCDFVLGASWNIPSYAALLQLFCNLTNRKPYEIIFSYGDVHIYEEHLDKFKEQMRRKIYPLPRLIINEGVDLDNVEVEDFKLLNYLHNKGIKYELIA